MLKAETSCIQTFQYHTSWSLPLLRASRKIRYWNLRVSLLKGRKVAPTVMDRAPRAVKLRNCTDTFEHVVIERNLARITLRNHIKNAEAMREIELKKRAEEVALEGDEKLAKSRFLVTTVGVPYILTDVAEIQDAVIDHNINHFSEAEDTSLGMGTFLHDAIGPHGTLEFCDRVLDQGLGKADKDDINYVEAYELLQHMQQQKTTINTLTSAMGS